LFLLVVLSFFLVGFVSATYTKITNFGSSSADCDSAPTNPSYTGDEDYCYGYFGSSGSNNDACACDSNQNNKVVCCSSINDRGVKICNKNAYTFTSGGHSITCPVPCTSSCLLPSAVVCGGSLNNGCKTGCLGVGMLCPAGSSCSGYACVPNYLINTTRWSNLINSAATISTANKGDTVLMVFGGQGLGGTQINYTIQDESSGIWGSILGLFGIVKPWDNFQKVSGNAIENISLSTDGRYRFIAQVSSTTVGNVSNNLTISGSENADPTASISLPNNFARYSTNYPIPFKQNSVDADDLLRITWDFGDSTSAVFNNYAYAINPLAADLTHSYSARGVYSVELTAQEMTRGQTSIDNRTIIILSPGINVIPIISSPKDGEFVGTGKVDFNIAQSFVVNCSTSAISGRDFSTVDGLLNCSYLHNPGQISTSAGRRILVNWSMGDGTYKLGNWSESYNSVVVFPKYYASSGEHVARVRLSYYG